MSFGGQSRDSLDHYLYGLYPYLLSLLIEVANHMLRREISSFQLHLDLSS